MNLQLKDWKKVSETDSHAILKNKQGHELKIAKKALSPKLRGQLAELEQAESDGKTPIRMAEGGQVPEINKKDAAEFEKGVKKSGWDPKGWAENVKEGLGMKKMADGGEVTPPKDDFDAMKESIGNFFTGDPAQQQADHDAAMASLPKTPEDASAAIQPVAMNPVEATSPIAQMAPESAAPMTAMPQVPGAAPEAAPQGLAPAPATLPAASPGLPGAGLEMQGYKDEAKATQQLAKDQQAIESGKIAAITRAKLDYDDKRKVLDTERAALQQDIANQKIDPNSVWNNKNTGQKIATTIGMLLGGFGQGMSNSQHNGVSDYLDKLQENDLKAQELNLGKKKSLLEFNMKKYGDLKDAMDMTRIQQNDLTAAQLGEAAAKASSPMAAAKLKQLQGQFIAKNAAAQDTLAQRQALRSFEAAAKQDPNALPGYIDAIEGLDPKKAGDMRGRLVNGIGLANTPEDAKFLKDTMGANNTAKTGIKDLLSLNKKPGATISLEDRARAEATSTMLVGALNKAITGGGPMSEGERKLVEGLARNPTTIFSLSASNKAALETLSRRLDAGFNEQAKARGLNVPSAESKLDPRYVEFAKKNPTHPASVAFRRKHNLD